jgi:hypothetical protein
MADLRQQFGAALVKSKVPETERLLSMAAFERERAETFQPHIHVQISLTAIRFTSTHTPGPRIANKRDNRLGYITVPFIWIIWAERAKRLQATLSVTDQNRRRQG